MKKIVIIGCGYLGSHLANYFLNKGWTVNVLGKTSYYTNFLKEDIIFNEVNITDITSLKAFIEEGDTVLYAAGSLNATNRYSDILLDIEVNYTSFVQLLDICAEKNISKFVFLSSAGTIYGDLDIPAKESSCLNPTNIYGLQKVFFENLIKIKQLETNSLPYLILRISNPYGGHQNPYKNQGIIPVLIHKALHNEAFTFWGNVHSVRDFIFITDFLGAVFKSLDLEGDEVLNIASGNATEISQVISIVEEITGRKINIKYQKSEQKTIMKNMFEISKLIELVDFTPSVTIYDGISMLAKSIYLTNSKKS